MADLELRPSQERINADRDELRANTYPGRVLITGLNSLGNMGLQAYALMGRSEGSRNRVFQIDDDNIRVVAPNKTNAEMAETENAALIYYEAMTQCLDVHVASNGAQTVPIAEQVAHRTALKTP